MHRKHQLSEGTLHSLDKTRLPKISKGWLFLLRFQRQSHLCNQTLGNPCICHYCSNSTANPTCLPAVFWRCWTTEKSVLWKPSLLYFSAAPYLMARVSMNSSLKSGYKCPAHLMSFALWLLMFLHRRQSLWLSCWCLRTPKHPDLSDCPLTSVHSGALAVREARSLTPNGPLPSSKTLWPS